MMATLFIGEQDAVFHWRDHQPMLLGTTLGVVLTIALVFALNSRKTSGSDYAAVSMNELKSKAQD